MVEHLKEDLCFLPLGHILHVDLFMLAFLDQFDLHVVPPFLVIYQKTKSPGAQENFFCHWLCLLTYCPVGTTFLVYINRRVSMGKTKSDEEKLNFQISFTLQQAVGRRLIEQCRLDNISVQNALRFIV